jgi:hypothetical protein
MMLLAMLLAAAPTAARPPSSRLDEDTAAVTQAATALAPHIDGASFDGKPGTDRLVIAQQQAVRRWVADWLDLNPRANPAALAEAGKRLGDDWSISAVNLGRDDMLVAIAKGWTSDVFIVGAVPRGRHRQRWSVSAPQRRLDRAGDHALSLWRPAIQNSNCGRCRIMGAPRVGRLPDTADGASRFWIEASYAQEMGATIGEQLSLWSWRDGHARPLLVRDFAILADQHGPVLHGATLHVPSKGDWLSLFACGSCFGRVTDLRFVVGPHGVRALRPLSETPELDLIDRVYARVLARQPAGALATPAALRVIRAQLRDRLAEKDPQLRDLAGMVGGWSRWRSNGRRWVCLAVDEMDPLAFSFDPSLRRITAARVLGAEACHGKNTRA